MKGKLILTDIQSPVEGMQVENKGRILTIFHKNGRNFTMKGEGNTIFMLSELKQIVVEYDKTRAIIPPETYKEILPLHPDDWKWAIEHIGEEVEFEALKASYEDKEKSIAVLESNVCYQRLKSFKEKYDPKLIHPVTYTEEEVKEILRIYASEGRQDDISIADWWNEHKKK